MERTDLMKMTTILLITTFLKAAAQVKAETTTTTTNSYDESLSSKLTLPRPGLFAVFSWVWF
jgi:hypothetical protein